MKNLSGVTMAMMVAGLASFNAAAESDVKGSVSDVVAANSSATDLVHCYDVNVCKGHNDCKTEANACGGHASCKGTGFVAMSAKACGDVGGKIKDSWVGAVTTADIVHCNDVNICKGHNDCKTAENACAGHASCKGTGFVGMSAKACGDIGGTVG